MRSISCLPSSIIRSFSISASFLAVLTICSASFSSPAILPRISSNSAVSFSSASLASRISFLADSAELFSALPTGFFANLYMMAPSTTTFTTFQIKSINGEPPPSLSAANKTVFTQTRKTARVKIRAAIFTEKYCLIQIKY